MRDVDRKRIFYIMEQISLDSDATEIILLTTDAEQIKSTIISEIRHGSLEYDGESTDEMENNFTRDWEEATMDDINSRLRFGYYGYGIDGKYGQIYSNNRSC